MNCEFFLEDPLLFASKLVSINPPTRYKRTYTTLSCLVLIFMVYGVVLFFISISDNLSSLVEFSLWLQLSGQTTLVITDFLTILIRPKNFHPPTQRLKIIEATLEPFGFFVDDQTLRTRLGVLEIFLSFLVPFGFGFLDLIDVIKGENFPYLLVYFSHYVYALTVININELLFVNNLCMIKRRFRELNRLVKEIDSFVASNRDDKLNEIEDERILDQLHTVKRAHYDLVQTVDEVNNAYGIHIFLSMVFTVVSITEQLYQNYEAIAWSDRTVIESIYTNYTWTSYHITRISLIIFACHSTCAEANKTASLIHAMPIRKTSQNLKDEIFHFCFQIQDRVSFSAAGFFDINLGALTSVTGAVITYLLIMIQMASVDQTDENNP